MKILLVGARSSLAHALMPYLTAFAHVTTAGRSGCDLTLDLAADVTLAGAYDAIINCAAHFGGNTAQSVIDAVNVNVLGPLRLCRAAGHAHVLHVSTIFAELDPASPFFSSYALSKRQGDEAAQLFASTAGQPLTIIRPAQLYGMGEAGRAHQPFLYSIMDKAERNEDIVVYGCKDALRNFLHVDDCARLIALAVQQRVTGVYRCVHPDNLPYSRIIQAAIAAFGSRSVLRIDAAKPDIPDNGFAPDDTLFRLLGTAPQISIEEGMQREAALRRTNETKARP